MVSDATLDLNAPEPATDPSQAAIERWRSDIGTAEHPDYMEGRSWGRTWALSRATYWQLERLDALRRVKLSQGLSAWRGCLPKRDPANPHSFPSIQIATLIGSPGAFNSPYGQNPRNLFADLGVDDPDSLGPEFCIGFADGAIAAFYEYRNRI